MLKTPTAVVSRDDDLARIRPVRSFLIWLIAGPAIGIGGGILFGAAWTFAAGSSGEQIFGGAAFGGFYGGFFGIPFGLGMGLVSLALARPRRRADLTTTVRLIGLIMVVGAGILAGIAWPALFAASLVGAALGLAAAPMLVAMTTAPVPKPIGDAAGTSPPTQWERAEGERPLTSHSDGGSTEGAARRHQ